MSGSKCLRLLGFLAFLAVGGTVLSFLPSTGVMGSNAIPICPLDCSGNGQCASLGGPLNQTNHFAARCLCNANWTGQDCSVPVCGSDADCDDLDPCSTDTCDTGSGLCEYRFDEPACLKFDAFKCYRAKMRGKFNRFSLTVEDKFGPVNIEVLGLTGLCTVASLNGTPLSNRSRMAGVECYATRPAANPGEPLSAMVNASSAFGAHPLELRDTLRQLCVPASIWGSP